MDWESVWKIVLAVIASIGGAGVIICGVAKFLSEKIADRLQAKYQLKLDKNMEKYKTLLDKKNYVTKTQFDLEFELYRKISKALFNYIVELSIPSKQIRIPGKDDHIDSSYLHNRIIDLVNLGADLQEVLYQNAPFIPKEIYDSYDELHDLMNNQFWIYYDRYLEKQGTEILKDEMYTDKDRENIQIIKDRFQSVNAHVREYLQSLQIIE